MPCPPRIEANQLVFAYPRGPIVLDQVSCAIHPGSITAIVGPNGAGKSTLLRLLAGLQSPQSGKITLDQHDLRSFPIAQRARQLAFIEQRPKVAFDFIARKVISFGAHTQLVHSGLIDDAIERFELTELAARPYSQLSVGQQQRVSFARAWVQISSNPNGALLADEPCSAMDPKHALATMHALQELAQSGIAVAIVIHDLSSAARWADHAIVLNSAGQLVVQGLSREVLTDEILTQIFDVQMTRSQIDAQYPVIIPTQH